MVTSRTGTTKWLKVAAQAKAVALEAGQFTCPICGVALDYSRSRQPNSPEVDHIVPYSQGGSDSLDNVRVICRLCNQQLGGRVGARLSRRSRASDRVVSKIFNTSGKW